MRQKAFILQFSCLDFVLPWVNHHLHWFACPRVFSGFLFKCSCYSEQWQSSCFILSFTLMERKQGITSFLLVGLKAELQWLKVGQEAISLKIGTVWAQNTWYSQSEPAVVSMMCMIKISHVCQQCSGTGREREQEGREPVHEQQEGGLMHWEGGLGWWSCSHTDPNPEITEMVRQMMTGNVKIGLYMMSCPL